MRLFRTILVAAVLHGLFTVSIPLLLVKLGNGTPLPQAFSGVFPALGFALVVLGAGVYAWALTELFLSTDAAPVPLAHPVRLRTSGIYARVRNPLLLGVVTILLGEATWFHSLLVLGYAILYWTLLHMFVMRVEEPDLERRFGASYFSYKVRVPRWIPRVGAIGSSLVEGRSNTHQPRSRQD